MAPLDFGIFSMFPTRVGATQAQIFKEWFCIFSSRSFRTTS